MTRKWPIGFLGDRLLESKMASRNIFLIQDHKIWDCTVYVFYSKWKSLSTDHHLVKSKSFNKRVFLNLLYRPIFLSIINLLQVKCIFYFFLNKILKSYWKKKRKSFNTVFFGTIKIEFTWFTWLQFNRSLSCFLFLITGPQGTG